MKEKAAIATQVIQEIDDYIRTVGGGYSCWYIGIASDPRDRLFNDHSVNKDNDDYIIRDCGSEVAASKVEKYFLNRNYDEGTGGGDDGSTRFAYAYKKNARTRP